MRLSEPTVTKKLVRKARSGRGPSCCTTPGTPLQLLLLGGKVNDVTRLSFGRAYGDFARGRRVVDRRLYGLVSADLIAGKPSTAPSSVPGGVDPQGRRRAQSQLQTRLGFDSAEGLLQSLGVDKKKGASMWRRLARGWRSWVDDGRVQFVKGWLDHTLPPFPGAHAPGPVDPHR